MVISVLVIGTLGLSYSTGAFAVPPDPQAAGNCETTGTAHSIEFLWCCWTETDPADPEQIEINKCQSCQIIDNSQVVCDPPVPDPSAPPTTGENIVPGDTGVLEQPEQPPLFGGQNDAGVPPTGGIEQPPTTTTPQIPPRLPGGGAGVPTEGGSAEQPPTPQDDNQGGGLPPIKNQENVPPGGGVAEQPEDDGQQEDSSEGEGTAGPLT